MIKKWWRRWRLNIERIRLDTIAEKREEINNQINILGELQRKSERDSEISMAMSCGYQINEFKIQLKALDAMQD